jgi:succinate dehydrogenase / fumarate reductase cytochrome b subunit
MCLAWLRSSIGKKTLMAASGLLLVGFVIVHLADNLLIFLGSDVLNGFAHRLHRLGPLLWSARILLLAAVIIHFLTSIQLTVENRRARGRRYAVYRTAETTLTARTMALSGLLLLAYVVYHLLHFTFRLTDPGLAHLTDARGRHDVYRMVVRSFQQPPVVLAYLAGLVVVCAHLHHSIGSVFQTLGLVNERTLPVVTKAGRTLALLLFLGYAAIPLAVLLGVVR